MEKTFKNESGNILVRDTKEKQFGSCGIVEMLHLWDKNKSGCVIGAWNVSSDGVPEFYSIGGRLTDTVYSFDILVALKYGQKLAELVADSREVEG